MKNLTHDANGHELSTGIGYTFTLAVGGPLAGKWTISGRPCSGGVCGRVDAVVTRGVAVGTVKVTLRENEVRDAKVQVAEVVIYGPNISHGDTTIKDRFPEYYAQAVAALREKVPGAEVAI